MTTLAVPSPQLASTSSCDCGKKPRPLSNHGMPKQPRNLTVERPHRFSDIGVSSPAFHSHLEHLRGPRSPGPFSPPLSAKSFGTFIDSEPSTPAYSPRADFGWDGSTLVLLKPLDTPYVTSFPHEETAWDLVDPRAKSASAKTVPLPLREVPTSKALSPLSIRSTRSSRSHHAQKEIKIVELSDKLSETSLDEDAKEDKENQVEDDPHSTANPQALNKLAAKMKTMLSRRASGEKKKSKNKKDYFDVEHLRDKHWTEM